MPVLLPSLSDPTDLVIQGEQLRAVAVLAPVCTTCPLIDDPPEDLPLSPVVLVAGEQVAVMQPDGVLPLASLQSQDNGGQVRNNAWISTPCGALVPILLGRHLMNDFVGGSTLWVITGVTRNSSGVALAACRVVALEIGRVQSNGAPVVAETISDGSGNYSLSVPLNTAYWLVAYKSGSPDVGGVSLATVTPTAV